MEANARALERVFDAQICYQVPLYQRPYIWNQESHWEPLWEDIQRILDDHVRGVEKTKPHFLGAVVLERLDNSTGGVQSRQVIDGQQRMTTLQLMLIAARDIAEAAGADKTASRFRDLVANRPDRIDQPEELYRLWPTNADRSVFQMVHGAGNPMSLSDRIDDKGDPALAERSIVRAYLFFHQRILSWARAELDPDGMVAIATNVEERLSLLWSVLMYHLKIVVIDLDKEDEAQVIFETLNARGEELLPADLIKNFLLRKSLHRKLPVEQLYERHWRPFDADHWRKTAKQGRITRPRIDTFINYYLAMKTREDVRAAHLFNDFKAYVSSGEEANPPLGPDAHLKDLARFGSIYMQLDSPAAHSRLALFMQRMAAIDTTTFMPFLLHAHAALMPANRGQFDRLLGLLESFLARRQIVNLPTKGYNKLFIDLIGHAGPQCDVDQVQRALLAGAADTSRFPDDAEMRRVLTEERFYGRLAQYKVRFVLEALDLYAFDPKSEIPTVPDDLTIEHVLPQSWEEHWPLDLPGEGEMTPEARTIERAKAQARRDRLLHTIGNLTLITGRLNPSLSNADWTAKRPELLKYSKLNLTRYFHEPHCETWDEAAIERRSATLAEQVVQLWPRPAG